MMTMSIPNDIIVHKICPFLALDEVLKICTVDKSLHKKKAIALQQIRCIIIDLKTNLEQIVANCPNIKIVVIKQHREMRKIYKILHTLQLEQLTDDSVFCIPTRAHGRIIKMPTLQYLCVRHLCDFRLRNCDSLRIVVDKSYTNNYVIKSNYRNPSVRDPDKMYYVLSHDYARKIMSRINILSSQFDQYMKRIPSRKWKRH